MRKNVSCQLCSQHFRGSLTHERLMSETTLRNTSLSNGSSLHHESLEMTLNFSKRPYHVENNPKILFPHTTFWEDVEIKLLDAQKTLY